MIVRRFLLWARSASPGHRAEAISALGRAYLHSDLDPPDRWEAETALTAMLDDPSAVVRRAMAESLASSSKAPRHVIVALAGDQSDVAELVLARSPLLADADLVDCAALGDERIQTAIASRPRLTASVCAALGEIGRPAALTALVRNRGADIPRASLARLVERHGDVAELREAMLERPGLPADIAQAIAVALAKSLDAFVVGCGWLSPERSGRIAREARERTTITLSARSDGDDVLRLVRHLRRSEQLTPALILRAILSGETGFVETAFAELVGLSERRVGGILRDGPGQSFRAIYERAGLPVSLRPAFEGAVRALRRGGGGAPGEARLSRRMIARALEACSALPSEEGIRLVALLHRFEVEAARDEARRIAGELADEAALAIVMEHAPEALDVQDPHPLAA